MTQFTVSIVPYYGASGESTNAFLGYRATAQILGRTLDFVEIRQTRLDALEAIFETIRREIP